MLPSGLLLQQQLNIPWSHWRSVLVICVWWYVGREVVTVWQGCNLANKKQQMTGLKLTNKPWHRHWSDKKQCTWHTIEANWVQLKESDAHDIEMIYSHNDKSESLVAERKLCRWRYLLANYNMHSENKNGYWLTRIWIRSWTAALQTKSSSSGKQAIVQRTETSGTLSPRGADGGCLDYANWG